MNKIIYTNGLIIFSAVVLSSCGDTQITPKVQVASVLIYKVSQIDRPAVNYELEVLKLTNEVRSKGVYCPVDAKSSGTKYYPPVGALTWNDTLAYAARYHAYDMANREYFDHNTLSDDLKSVLFRPEERIEAAGYDYQETIENLARAYPNPGEVVQAWLGSYMHCPAIMSKDVKELGVGYASSKELNKTKPETTYWVQEFGITRADFYTKP